MLLEAAKEIFHRTLLKLDAGDAVKRVLKTDGRALIIGASRFVEPKLYVISVGKAAYRMAAAFEELAGTWIKKGVISGSPGAVDLSRFKADWRTFVGGHPLPDEASIAAASESIEMLREANAADSVIVFLVSGGGSAMMELPAAGIQLAELRSLNQILVTAGATISEINAVRRAVSQVKGGGLARLATEAKQISFVISDTLPGDISSVASGPSMPPAGDIPDANEVIEKYGLASRLPKTVLHAIGAFARQMPSSLHVDSTVHVLLDNGTMRRQAAAIAEAMGFQVRVDERDEDSDITRGCERLITLLARNRPSTREPFCIISGGEFTCEVKGNGTGGRNLETVLRLSLLAAEERSLDRWTVLSCGTDGIDGNSPAAGAVADETSLLRAVAAGLDPRAYLEASDSFTFFDHLDGTIVTGPTGTNVRDIRILLAN